MKNYKSFLAILLVFSFMFLYFTYASEPETDVVKVSDQRVAVSGESFGIKLYTQGVLVVDATDVDTAGGDINPAQKAGIKVGDIIIAINGISVTTSSEVAKAFENCDGNSIEVKVNRDGQMMTFQIDPQMSVSSGKYKVGLWVRDSTAGIGTITYYDTKGNFAGLGHGINDVDTGKIMPLGNGEAVYSKIIGLKAAEKGTAGELYGQLESKTIGEVKLNTEAGIFGKLNQMDGNLNYIPVAADSEIKKGAAQIATTIDGTGVQYYDVEITKVYFSSKDTTRNMVIKITDERLLAATGGILQGMSGSPIIQDGKFVGALTHVFVNKPQQGYAIFASNMLEQSNTL